MPKLPKRHAPQKSRSPLKPNGSQVFKSVSNAFGIDNAKQLKVEETVRFFVSQPKFASLFVPKNHILLGSRGSGKTTWVRMMAHDHVVLAAKDPSDRMDYARGALDQHLIGIYVPASSAFAGDLRNKPWQSDQEAEEYFVWRLNLHICSALTHILPSCIEQYKNSASSPIELEYRICEALSASWSDGRKSFTTFDGLRLLLSEIELQHQAALRRRRTSRGAIEEYFDHFDTEALLPLRNSIDIVRMHLQIPTDATWMICLDEVEYLSPLHHRILNTQMRAASGGIVFKLATMPFAHHTLETNLSEGDPVREGHDFEYVYVDQEPIDSRGAQADGEFATFARELFKRRVADRNEGLRRLSLRALLGPSPLLEDKRVENPEEMQSFMALLRRHANDATIARAERLFGTPKFKSEIVRKLHGVLYLRDAISSHQGNAKIRVYSGEATVLRCCDGNARRFMRVINSIVQKLQLDDKNEPILPVDSGTQNEILESFARDTLHRTQSEPPHGKLTADYLNAIGAFMRQTFLASARKLGTDQVGSIRIVADDGLDGQRFIKQAIQLSLMIPAKSVSMKTPDVLCEGEFHLAFLFSPYFKIFPRRNESVRLSRILNQAKFVSQKVEGGANQSSLFGENS